MHDEALWHFQYPQTLINEGPRGEVYCLGTIAMNTRLASALDMS